MAYGELFTIITAGIDLSVGSVARLHWRRLRHDADRRHEHPGRRRADALDRAGDGLVNGLAIDRLGIPAFIVTLAGLQGYRGATMLISGSMTVAGLPDSLGNFANSYVFGVPTMFLVMLAFAAVSQYLLGATRTGRYMYALGSNIEAARRVGVNVTRVTLIAYGLASLFATVAGMLLVARLTMGNPNGGVGLRIAGDRRRGGRGRVPVRRTRHDRRLLHRRASVHHHRQRRKSARCQLRLWRMAIEELLPTAGLVYLDNLQKRKAQGQ